MRSCADCRTPVTSTSRGLCHRCYQRHYKRGDLHEYALADTAGKSTCTRCPRPADAGRGLCKRCYTAHRDRQIGYGRWTVRRRRLDAHARGEWCDACGAQQWPHGDEPDELALFAMPAGEAA